MRRSERVNLAERTGERWQPPAFVAPVGVAAQVQASIRRFFDLPAGSIWHDLSELLRGFEGSLVDVGCGAQPYRGLLGPGASYRGLDTADAAEHFGYGIDDVLIIGEDGTWPVEDRSADCVLATETLEHVFEPRPFLAQAARVVAPGGRLILTVPFAARWHYIPHDHWRYTPSTLAALLQEAGFEQVVVTGRGDERTVAIYKLLALLLALAVPQQDAGQMRVRPLALLLAPLIVLLAGLGNLTLRGEPGDDTLGYTVTAVRAPQTP